MRVAVDTEDIDLQSLPRFQRATRHAALLLKIFLGLAGLVVIMAGSLWRWPDAPWQPVLVNEIAMLLVLAATVQSAWWVCRCRAEALRALEPLAASDSFATTDNSIAESLSTRWQARWQALCNVVLQFMQRHISASAAAAMVMGLLSVLALLLVMRYWNLRLSTGQAGTRAWIFIAALLSLAFALLVLERFFAGSRIRELPEALSIAYLLRVSITLTVLVGACVALSNELRQWPGVMLVGIGILPAAVALELLLRALLSAFSPPQSQREPEMLAESLIAGMWRWPLQPFKHLHDELKQRFGIDLRQSWAFAYIRRAILPVSGVLLALAWLLSGIAEIPIASRGIYERFGKPVAVWSPGLHAGLPWPLARVRRMENGVVHELATASASMDDQSATAEPDISGVEDAPPASANRLWDASHVAEKSQVIASQSTIGQAAVGPATIGQVTTDQTSTRQSFHVVNMDVRFMYRIGLTDADAIKATYNSSDVPTLIRSTANRILVGYFASRTLEGVLGEQRTQLALDIGAQLQADLDALNSGVEIMATVIEAIHPPAAAATAYHSVQAAQISAQAIIARERGKAAEQVNLAQLRAGMTGAQAAAGARETVAAAEAAQLRFAAERDAYATAGKAFLLEQYLAQLTHGLSNAQLVIIDHRLRSATPTIDLRSFGAPVDASPRKGGQ